jgi:hypothetical protein
MLTLTEDGHYPYPDDYQANILAALLQYPDFHLNNPGIWKPSYFSSIEFQVIADAYEDILTVQHKCPDEVTFRATVLERHCNSPDSYKDKLTAILDALYTHEVVDKEWMEHHVPIWAHDMQTSEALIHVATKMHQEHAPKVIEAFQKRTEENSNCRRLLLHRNCWIRLSLHERRSYKEYTASKLKCSWSQILRWARPGLCWI